jgi:molybdopterin-containing oxidoreductase family membrane subunit
MFIVSILVNIGMWYERFVIIVTSLNSDFLPSVWRNYYPTLWDWGWTAGSFGMFFTFFLLFCRTLPMIAMSEVKGVMSVGHKGDHHG